MNFKIKNPLFDSWYADPEARRYENKYWIYVTRSLPYEQQMNLDVLCSEDLTHWDAFKGIIQMNDFPWIKQAVWAPSIVEKNGKYYLIFASNDIQNDSEIGGLEMAVADHPQGPFRGYLGKSLIDQFINGAQPIDAHFFKDDDGTIYLFYGGWKHCNVCMMNEDMTGFLPFPDGETFKEITPPDYVEAPCMFKRNNLYYFMWSSGSWTNASYCVKYATSTSPVSGFGQEKTILSEQSEIANGPGHNGYLYIPENGAYLNVYHRHKLDNKDRNARFVCIDQMVFDGDDIRPVIMTHEWEN